MPYSAANSSGLGGDAMKDAALKIKILWWMLTWAFQDWKRDVAGIDMDSYHCCNGHECGCQGVSNRQVLEQKK